MRLTSSAGRRGAAVLVLGLLLVGCASSSSNPGAATRPSAMRPAPKVQTENGVAGLWNHLTGLVSGNTPIKFVRMMEDSSSPDRRRQGIYELVKRDFGQREPYTARYRQIAQADADFTVRAAAVRALNWSRDTSAVPVFIAALNDASELVRWEAAKALANVPDPSAVDPLTRTLTSAGENRNVRIAAADALRHYRTAPVARALVGTLNGRDFGIAWQARHSLRTMTGRDLRYDDRAWLQYLASPEKPVS
jgi:hypothetical protein